MPECIQEDFTHQISHDKNIDKCLFCQKSLEDIRADGDDFNLPSDRG